MLGGMISDLETGDEFEAGPLYRHVAHDRGICAWRRGNR